MHTYVPLISSGVAGPLGVLHLPRLWLKSSLEAQGKLATGYPGCGKGYDQMVVDGLGLKRDAVIAFVKSSKPTYPQFEAWVKKHATHLDKASIDKLNSAIKGYIHDDATRKECARRQWYCRRRPRLQRRRQSQQPRRLERIPRRRVEIISAATLAANHSSERGSMSRGNSRTYQRLGGSAEFIPLQRPYRHGGFYSSIAAKWFSLSPIADGGEGRGEEALIAPTHDYSSSSAAKCSPFPGVRPSPVAAISEHPLPAAFLHCGQMVLRFQIANLKFVISPFPICEICAIRGSKFLFPFLRFVCLFVATPSHSSRDILFLAWPTASPASP